VVCAIFQNDDTLHETVDFDIPGFVFAPFEPSRKWVFLRKDRFGEASYAPSPIVTGKPIDYHAGDKDFHIDLLQKAKRAMAGTNGFKKVVVSRVLKVMASQHGFDTFTKAMDHYPNAFCYLFFHPKVGCWLGATPERLLLVENDKVTTSALAGTLPYVKGQDPKWTVKEMEEQQFVTDYIVDGLGHALTRLQLSERESIKAGALWHFKTTITGDLKKNRPLANIIRLLHPTPAVCGLPKTAAFDFITTHEGYDREYYTGFLGEVAATDEKRASLFVNLRCMKILGDQHHIYVGGGITPKSNVEAEWEETQLKAQTMLRLLE